MKTRSKQETTKPLTKDQNSMSPFPMLSKQMPKLIYVIVMNCNILDVCQSFTQREGSRF